MKPYDPTEMLAESFLFGDVMSPNWKMPQPSPIDPSMPAGAMLQQPQQELIGSGMTGEASAPVGAVADPTVRMQRSGGFGDIMSALTGMEGNTEDLAGAKLAYQNTQNTRFKGLGGAIERIVDAVKEPKAREEYAKQLGIAEGNERQLAAQTKLETQDAYFQSVMELTGSQEMARAVAGLAGTDPEAARKTLEQIGKAELDTQTAAQKDAVAMGMEPGSPEFNKYIKEATISKSNQHIYGPQLEKGYRWVDGKVGVEMEPIPGGSVAMANEEKRQQIKTNIIKQRYQIGNTLNQIDRAMEQNGIMTTGFFGSLLSNIPGTAAADMKEMLMTEQATAAFDALMEMRQASVTGGALANVSNREIELLERLFRLESLNRLIVSGVPARGEGVVRVWLVAGCHADPIVL